MLPLYYTQVILFFLLNLPRKSTQQNGGFLWPQNVHTAVPSGAELSNIIFDDSSEQKPNVFVPAQANDNNNNNQKYPFQQQQQQQPNIDVKFSENESRKFNGNNGGQPSTPPSRQISENSRNICEHNCLTTSQYDPVCGDDKKTYHNEGKLRCAQKCGKKVRLLSRVACELTT